MSLECGAQRSKVQLPHKGYSSRACELDTFFKVRKPSERQQGSPRRWLIFCIEHRLCGGAVLDWKLGLLSSLLKGGLLFVIRCSGKQSNSSEICIET